MEADDSILNTSGFIYWYDVWVWDNALFSAWNVFIPDS